MLCKKLCFKSPVGFADLTEFLLCKNSGSVPGIFLMPDLERVAGIEPASSAWKAEVLPLNYTRTFFYLFERCFLLARSHVRTLSSEKMVEGEGFEPSKAKPSDLQSGPFDHSGTPPENLLPTFI